MVALGLPIEFASAGWVIYILNAEEQVPQLYACVAVLIPEERQR